MSFAFNIYPIYTSTIDLCLSGACHSATSASLGRRAFPATTGARGASIRGGTAAQHGSSGPDRRAIRACGVSRPHARASTTLMSARGASPRVLEAGRDYTQGDSTKVRAPARRLPAHFGRLPCSVRGASFVLWCMPQDALKFPV